MAEFANRLFVERLFISISVSNAIHARRVALHSRAARRRQICLGVLTFGIVNAFSRAKHGEGSFIMKTSLTVFVVSLNSSKAMADDISSSYLKKIACQAGKFLVRTQPHDLP